jgi:signal transduction histidine kinase
LLAAVRLDLNQLMNCSGDRSTQNALLESMDQRLMEAISSLRRLAFNLRPRVLDEDGLFYALQGLRQDFANQHSIRCDLLAREEDLHLDDAASTAVFRVIQEALTNIARHARASRVMIRLARQSERLVVAVEDDGCGISATHVKRQGAMGLLGMRERIEALGGEFAVVPAFPRGTRCDISLPLEQVSSHNL